MNVDLKLENYSDSEINSEWQKEKYKQVQKIVIQNSFRNHTKRRHSEALAEESRKKATGYFANAQYDKRKV